MIRKESKWVIRYWCNNEGGNTLEAWLDLLTDEQLKSVAKEMTLLSLCGIYSSYRIAAVLKKGYSS